MTVTTTSAILSKGPTAKEAKRMIENNPQKAWVDLSLKYGKNFIYQGSLATSDPEVVQHVLMHRPHTVKRSSVYKLMSRIIPGAPGVLFMDGQKWHKHVQAVMPVFTKANIDIYAQTIHNIVKAKIVNWRDGQEMNDLYQAITEIGLNMVLEVGYGLNTNNDLHMKYGKELMNYKLETMNSPARIDEFGFTPNQLKVIPKFLYFRSRLKQRMKRMQLLVKEIIQERKQHNPEGNDWFSLLSKAGLPLKMITDELNHIYGAFNAIDYTITCAFYELNRNPEWATIIREELNNVLGDRAFPSREDFEALPNTIHFMKEVFRYYPVAIAVMRKTGEPLSFGSNNFPANEEVLILIQSLHHHPDYWDDPQLFNPDRWKQYTRDPKAYIPFLIGPRQCIGRHLAELHFIITISTVLRNWTIELKERETPIVPHLIPRFSKAMPFTVNSISVNS